MIEILNINIPTLKNIFVETSPVEYIIIAVGDDITVKKEKPEAIAEDRAKEISVGCSSIAIGPISDTVAELVKKLAVNPDKIAIIDQLTFSEFEGRVSKNSLNLNTSHDEAPVSLIWKPRDIVAAKSRMTPQFGFLFISSQEIIPKIINVNAPARAIIPNP